MRKIYFVITSIVTLIMGTAIIIQSCSIGRQANSIDKQTGILGKQADSLDAQTKILNRQFELEYIPLVKIGPISINAVPYTPQTGPKSIAVYFSIPIENRQGSAYDIRILDKTIGPVRGNIYGKEIPSLQSALTASAFDLSDGQIRYDKIGIDIPDFEKYLKGEKSFTLKYQIEYNALPEATKDLFVYNYEAMFTNGRFEIVEDKTTRKKGN